MSAEWEKGDHGGASILVTLPGGHEILARLHARRQVKDGWRYQVGFLIWQDTAEGGVESVEHRVWVSPAHARPVPGTSYEHAPTLRSSQTGSTQPDKGRPAWTIQHLPHRPGHPGATLVHVIGCTPSTETLDREQALTALRQPRATACRECGAAGSLTDTNRNDPSGQAPQEPTPTPPC